MPNARDAVGSAIDRLVSTWNSGPTGPKRLEDAKTDLIRLGREAHARLLGLLRSYRKHEKEKQLAEWQMRLGRYVKRAVVEVLRDSGNRTCLAPLREIVEADPQIAEEGAAALRTIAQREGQDVQLPAGPEPIRLKAIAPTGDAYVDDCFGFDVAEHYDARRWFEFPEAKAAAAAGRARRFGEALRLAESLRRSRPDFYYPYWCAAWFYREERRYQDSRAAVREGLRHAKSKYVLCEAMAETELLAGDAGEAVKWWIRSVAIQVSAGSTDSYPPFLELAYAADALHLGRTSRLLKERADRIYGPGGILLSPDAASQRRSAMRNGPVDSMRRALQLLEREYLELI